MGGVRLFMFIVLIPALVAFGHDIYLFVTNEGTDAVLQDAQRAYADKGALTFFASLGFIWTNYEPESFRTVADSVDQETWKIITSILSYKAVFAGLAFAGFFYVLLGLMKILKIGSFKAESSSKGPRSSKKGTKMMYKHK